MPMAGNGAKAEAEAGHGTNAGKTTFCQERGGDYVTVTVAKDILFTVTVTVTMDSQWRRFFRFQIEIRKCWPREKRRNH